MTIKTGNRQDSSLARGMVLLVHGRTLFETLMLNLSEYTPSEADRPIWEVDDSEDMVTRDRVAGRLDLYTAQSRRLRLVPPHREDGLVCHVHFAQGRKLRDLVDPMKPHMIRNQAKGPELISLDEDRATWRDSTSLLELARRRSPSESNMGAAALELIAMAAEADCIPRVTVPQMDLIGIATQKGKATSVVMWRHERLPLPLPYLSDKELVADLKLALSLAETVDRALWSAIRQAAKVALSPTDPNGADPSRVKQMIKSFGSENFYWSQLERPFKQLVIDLPGDEAIRSDEVHYAKHRLGKLCEWFEQTLKLTARYAFDRTAGQLDTSARANRAAVEGESTLNRGLGAIQRKYFKGSREKEPTHAEA